MSLWLVPVALAVGLLLGALGGGGAILTVPILASLLHQAPAQATAGSLVIVGLSALLGLVPHLRAGRVAVTDGLLFGVLGSVGAVVGSRLSVLVPGPLLMTAFAALLLVVAAVMVRKQLSADREATPGRGDSRDHGSRRGWPVRLGAATVVGLLTGFFGVGGGFVIVPALTLVLGLSMTRAVATSLLVIAINSAVSLVTRATGGLRLDWGVVLPFAGVAVVGTLLGGRLGRMVGQRRLAWVFVALLVVVAVSLAVQNGPRLVGG